MLCQVMTLRLHASHTLMPNFSLQMFGFLVHIFGVQPLERSPLLFGGENKMHFCRLNTLCVGYMRDVTHCQDV